MLSTSNVSDGSHGYGVGMNVILHAKVVLLCETQTVIKYLRRSHTIQHYHSRHLHTENLQSRKVITPLQSQVVKLRDIEVILLLFYSWNQFDLLENLPACQARYSGVPSLKKNRRC